jgi:hypothetical protein
VDSVVVFEISQKRKDADSNEGDLSQVVRYRQSEQKKMMMRVTIAGRMSQSSSPKFRRKNTREYTRADNATIVSAINKHA